MPYLIQLNTCLVVASMVMSFSPGSAASYADVWFWLRYRVVQYLLEFSWAVVMIITGTRGNDSQWLLGLVAIPMLAWAWWRAAKGLRVAGKYRRLAVAQGWPYRAPLPQS